MHILLSVEFLIFPSSVPEKVQLLLFRIRAMGKDGFVVIRLSPHQFQISSDNSMERLESSDNKPIETLTVGTLHSESKPKANTVAWYEMQVCSCSHHDQYHHLQRCTSLSTCKCLDKGEVTA